MYFQQVFEEKLAQYAYIIGCQQTGEAIVIDPMRDIWRYEEIAAKNKLRIIAAAETHIHADYLSGLREFAEKGVKIYASDEGDKDWKYEWLIGSSYNFQLLKNGNKFSIGNIKFRVLYTPGHTPEHISFMVADGAATDEPMGILSGDFVFVGDVGRPDLLETAAGQKGVMESSAKILYQSLQKFKEMPEYLQLWPGHGAGSACGKALGAVPESTVGYEQQFNISVRAAVNEQDFLNYILEGQPEPPLYFARMKRENKKGPKLLGEIPKPEHISIQNMIGKIRLSNGVILDTRSKNEFMQGHIQGSLLSPLNKQFNTVAGSYIKENEQIYLIIEEDKLEEAVLDLIRIGLDNIAGYSTPEQLQAFADNGGELFRTETIDFKQVEEYVEKGEAYILDVRKQTEYEAGHHPEAINIAHTRLLERLKEVPADKPLMVHCKSGVRAAVASAMLEREDFAVKYVDDLVEPWLKKKEYTTA